MSHITQQHIFAMNRRNKIGWSGCTHDRFLLWFSYSSYRLLSLYATKRLCIVNCVGQVLSRCAVMRWLSGCGTQWWTFVILSVIVIALLNDGHWCICNVWRRLGDVLIQQLLGLHIVYFFWSASTGCIFKLESTFLEFSKQFLYCWRYNEALSIFFTHSCSRLHCSFA